MTGELGMWLCQITTLAASATATFALPSAAPWCGAKETDGGDYSEKASIIVALPALIEKNIWPSGQAWVFLFLECHSFISWVGKSVSWDVFIFFPTRSAATLQLLLPFRKWKEFIIDRISQMDVLALAVFFPPQCEHLPPFYLSFFYSWWGFWS